VGGDRSITAERGALLPAWDKTGAGFRRIATFGLLALSGVAVMVVLYPLVFPPYASAVMAAVNVGYRATSIPLELRTAEGGDIGAWVRHPDGSTRWLVTDHDPEGIFLSLILLPPLLLATPVPLRRRATLLATGCALLFLVHAACVGFLFHELRLESLGRSGPLSSWILAAILTSGQVGAFVLWALLTALVWFPGAAGRVRAREDGVARNAPCPCGSGRKFKSCCAAGRMR
jgi:hypothetical protein